MGYTTEETVNVKKNTPEIVEEPAEISEKSVNTAEISSSTWSEETDENTNLEYSVSDREKFFVEKVAVIVKGEAGKDFKTDSNTQMKQYPILDLRLIWDVTSVAKIYL